MTALNPQAPAVTIGADELGWLLVCSFRYALGRMTYVVSDVARALIRHREVLSAADRTLIIREIRKAADRDGLGMVCDADEWTRVVAALAADGTGDAP